MRELPDPYVLAFLLLAAVALMLSYNRLLVAVRGGVSCLHGLNGTQEMLGNKYICSSVRLAFFLLVPFYALTLVLAGSIPESMPGTIYSNILEALQGRGIRFVVDATKDLLLNVLQYHPFLIKPNHHEIGEIFGVKLETRESVVPYAKKLQEMGATNVLVSMSGMGAVLLDENGDAIKPVVVNTYEDGKIKWLETIQPEGGEASTEAETEGAELAFMYGWDGSGSEGDDLYFNASVDGKVYTFVVESNLCDENSEVYQTVKNLKVGDQIDMEGFLYWYEGAQPHIISVTLPEEEE